MNPTSPHAPAQVSTRAALVAAASVALPIGALDVQAFGSRTQWGSHTRPARIEARKKALRVMVRAATRAMQERPDLDLADVAAAMRALALQPSDLIVCPITGKWLAPPAAVRHRGEEIARALVELALSIREVGSEQDNG